MGKIGKVLSVTGAIMACIVLGRACSNTVVKENEKSFGTTAPVMATSAPTPMETSWPMVDADSLINAYKANEINADGVYKGKTFIIIGPVSEINETLGVLTVSLGTDQYAFSKVRLYLKQSDKEWVAKLIKGQELKVKGTIRGLGMDVEVEKVGAIQ